MAPRTPSTSPGEITRLLRQLGDGNPDVEVKLVPLVYEQLRRVAAHYMRRERRDHTLQPTALVHEAYLKLIEQDRVTWDNRAHFYCVAARLMRRILVDHAREVNAIKRAGHQRKVELEPEMISVDDKTVDLLAINEVLDRLAVRDPRQARIVELRFFGGCPEAEIARTLEISLRTVKRDWRVARAWLYAELSKK